MKITNWLKYTKVYFVLSAIVIVAGIYAITSWGFPLGLDFTGGAVIDYKIPNPEKKAELETKFKEANIS